MAADVEVKFARRLASNSAKVRGRALNGLRRWISARSSIHNAFSELELLKLWKGLYLCMWHCDKPLLQEELAENFASFIHLFHCSDTAWLFVAVFFKTMAREWHGIDRLRLDKFYTLIRRVVRHCFGYLKSKVWEQGLVGGAVEVLASGPLCPDLSQTCSGVQLHVVEVYVPELIAMATGCVSCVPSLELLQPCCNLLAMTKDLTVAETLCRSIFDPITEGLKAAKLQLDLMQLSECLLRLAVSRETRGKNRKKLYTLHRRFVEVAGQQGSSAPGIEATEVQREGWKARPKQPKKDAQDS